MTDVPVQRRTAVAVVQRAAVAVTGGCLLAVGLLLVPLPGPGWPVVFLGLAVLGSEFAWADRLRHRVQAPVTRGLRWSASRNRPTRLALSAAALVSAAGPALVLVGRV